MEVVRCARKSLGSKLPPMAGALLAAAVLSGPSSASAAGSIDFNRDVRRILSQNCFSCHGPDSKVRQDGKVGLRLDLAESAHAEHQGRAAIVPGHPEKSELIRRITTQDKDDHMPPLETGKTLTPVEVAILKQWIQEGGVFSKHWSYIPPVKAALPGVKETAWGRQEIDRFVLARLEKEGLKPAVEADKAVLLRRVALDLTGLPPSLEELDAALADTAPGAYERFVARQFKKSAFGEHWARLWLDQARYADSSGYADDPARTIWAYRDYVIRSFNANKPFDQFTLEQIAGDLLPDATDEQIVATAFHRNTMTNNEGGTNDEEYRNVAVIDRVNTTLAVWMGTTINCAQCHNHKYDPISQDEFFRLYAILNNTADADRGDETPILALFTPEQKLQRKQWQTALAVLERRVQTPTSDTDQEQAHWEKEFERPLSWQAVIPSLVKSSAGAAVEIVKDGRVKVASGAKTDTYEVEVPLAAAETVTALRLETLPDETPPGRGVGHAAGNYVLTGVQATVVPPSGTTVSGRILRIELPGKERILSLAEVQVFHGTNNVAIGGEARQSSTEFGGDAKLAVDGKTDGRFAEAKSTTHTRTSDDPWWEVDLKTVQRLDRVAIWNRTDGVGDRLRGFRVMVLGDKREILWEQMVSEMPNPSTTLAVDGTRTLPIAVATADYSGKDFPASAVIGNKDPKHRGWSIAPRYGEAHRLDLLLESPVSLTPGSRLLVRLEQQSQHENATVAQFRVARSSDPRASALARIPSAIVDLLGTPASQRTEAQRGELRRHFLTVAPSLETDRQQLAQIRRRLEESKPYTTVPVLRELAVDQRRTTHVQRRGNWMDLGKEVREGVPAAFHPLGTELPADRLSLAQWLASTNNPLTARVIVNRMWENIFGMGLVRTSEEFGAQGELPSHPELLDWLAVEFMEKGWDFNHMLELLVTSATYRQSSKVSPELAAADPDNRLLARGPRFRQSAEMIRDQALFVSGLLSAKMYGPPVKPPQPKMGLSAAFGSGTDWETSMGEDRYRRGLYTTWRRSNPYPSMAAFDAPNREVCWVRRERSNTPLQALVTLNDPVYTEAAQALARRVASGAASLEQRVALAFKLCLSRPPSAEEQRQMADFYGRAVDRFKADPAKAMSVATKPLGPLPEGRDPVELAALTMMGNVLLNLDELLMKP